MEAALLDEEDAEDRYQLRMQRIREKQKTNEDQQRMLQESKASEEAGAPQVPKIRMLVSSVQIYHIVPRGVEGWMCLGGWFLR